MWEKMENEIQYKSKTQIKKEAEELQKLGEKLLKLSKEQLNQIDIPDFLREAVIDTHAITSNVAARRQRQYLGTLMRETDPEPIRKALMALDAGLPIESEKTKEAEQWFERLSMGTQDEAENFIALYPGANRQKLKQLIRNAKKEPKSGKTDKSSKNLKKYIRENMGKR